MVHLAVKGSDVQEPLHIQKKKDLKKDGKNLIEAKDENSNLLREGETVYFNAIKKEVFLVSSQYLAVKASYNLTYVC